MGRKIPGRKHRGIRDPEKQAAARFESIKNKINAPPTNTENQEIPKSLQKVIDLKNKLKNGEFFNKKKMYKNDKLKNTFFNKEKPDRQAREFHQFVGESDREFVRRMNKICSNVVKEAKFEDKYGVEIKRNAEGEIEGVVKRQKDELELMLKKAKNKKQKEDKRKTKKNKEKQFQPKLSKWQKRKKKLNAKKDRKENENVDEFKQYKDQVKFGEIAHAPPSLTAPRNVEKNSAARPGSKNLILKTLIKTENKETATINEQKDKNRNSLNKTIHKTIDKKGKRKELPNSLRRHLDQQQKEIINAYKELKAKKYK